MSNRIIVDELEFEVPYGKLAAKTWHEETDDCKRVLALHGWMDNSGSFDNLIPHIKHKEGLYIVGLDLPGHGKSSQLPPGSSYSDINIVLEIRRCVTELGWIKPPPKRDNNGDMSQSLVYSSSFDNVKDALNQQGEESSNHRKFTIMGHSFGAGMGLFYTSLFPDDVEEIVLIDFIKTRTMPAEEVLFNTADAIDQFINVVPSQSPFSSPIVSRSTLSSNKDPNKGPDKGKVTISQEAAIIATIQGRQLLGSITRDDAACLLKRSTVAVSTPPNCVIYNRDLRLNHMLNLREHWDVNKIMFAKVKCHAISIIAKTGLYGENVAFRDKLPDIEEYLTSKLKSYHVQWVDADHYLHMNKPKLIADIINRYFESPTEYKVVPMCD